MTDLMIEPNELRNAAQQFDQAGKDLDVVLKRLDETTSGLKEKWEGVSQQVFYKQYKEIHQVLEGFTFLLGHISIEMGAMADRFDKADQ